MSRKSIRQKELLQFILDKGFIPKTSELAEAFKVSDRTIRRDFEEISGQISDVAVEDIHQMVLLRLRKRVPEMADKYLIELAEFFLAKKKEITGRVETEITLKSWDLGQVDAKGNRR